MIIIQWIKHSTNRFASFICVHLTYYVNSIIECYFPYLWLNGHSVNVCTLLVVLCLKILILFYQQLLSLGIFCLMLSWLSACLIWWSCWLISWPFPILNNCFFLLLHSWLNNLEGLSPHLYKLSIDLFIFLCIPDKHGWALFSLDMFGSEIILTRD